MAVRPDLAGITDVERSLALDGDKSFRLPLSPIPKDVIKAADWIIDLGPEGGEEGGQIVAEGRPEQVAEIAHSHTGRFLQPVLNVGL